MGSYLQGAIHKYGYTYVYSGVDQMTSRAIMIRKVVYDALSKQKRRGESFSMLLERMMLRPSALRSLVGAWKVRGEVDRKGPDVGEARARGRL